MVQEHNEAFIGGNLVAAHGSDRVSLVNPATEAVIATVPNCDDTDVDRAVGSAHEALVAWSKTSPQERASLLYALADEYEARADEIAELVTAENGSPTWWATYANGGFPVGTFRNAARLAETLEPEEIRAAGGGRSIVRREPVGVVGAIVPWNAPQALLAGKLGPALAAGCTVVVKPSPETSLDALVLAEILDKIGTPPGVVNIVTGGRDTGAALVRNIGTNKISFTGSTAAGRAIAAICGEQLKPVSAELGGKSAAVLLADANLEKFGESIISQCLPYSGQVCYSWTRVLVHESRFAETLELVRSTLAGAPVGDPTDPATIFGPLVTATQRERVEGYIASGLRDGARLALGGGRPSGLSPGYYVEPTIFIDVDPNMAIFQEEIFGPVLVIVPFADDETAVALANDSTYGLSGAVFGDDVARATNVARQMETGRVVVNGERGASGGSAGGYKNSGLGREGSMDAINNYLQLKSLTQPV